MPASGQSLCRRGVRALCVIAWIALGPLAFAQTAVPVWQQDFRPAAKGTTSPNIIAARELADGSLLAVTDELVALHFDANGNPLSSLQLPAGPRAQRTSPPSPASSGPEGGFVPGYLRTFAAIDSFGAIVIARVGDPDYSFFPYTGDIVTTKYDGLTGHTLWAHPAIYDSGIVFAADYPTGVFLDSIGNVIVVGLTALDASFFEHLTLKYDGQTGGLLWGPMILAGVTPPGTASVDLDGDIYLSVAREVSSGGPLRFTTLKYDRQNGAIVWGPVATDGDTYDYPHASAFTPDGGFIVTGSLGDQLGTIKYGAYTGSVIWTATTPIPGSSSSKATGVAVDAAGNVFVSGDANGACATLKLSGASGSILWGPQVAPEATDPTHLVVFGNGDVVLDPILSGPPASLGFLRYRGADGALVWGPASVGALYGYPTYSPSSFVASNGNVFGVAGFVDGASITTKVFELAGADGGFAWGPTPITLPALGTAYLDDLSAGSDGTLAVVGHDFQSGQVLTLKYDRATGTLLWGPVSYGSVDSRANAWQSLVDSAGNVLVLGSTSEAPGGAFVTKYAAADGSVLWGPTILSGVSPIRLVLDGANNPVATGSRYGGFSYDAVTTKISGATGAVDWTDVYDSGMSQNDIPRALSTDAGGNVFVVGFTNTGIGYNWFVTKHAATDGAVLWGPVTDQSGYAWTVATDPSGDIAVGGADGSYAMATMKFSGANGAVLWGPEIVVSGGGWYAEARAVVTGPTGDVYVTGNDSNDGATTDFVTAKYRGSDGAPLWGPVFFDGEAHGFDFVNDLGIGLDESGNVVVGGSSRTQYRYYDSALLKYDGNTGATLWGPVYAGGSDDDYLGGFSVQGNSVVAAAPSSGAFLVIGFDETFGIQTLPPDPSPAYCGDPYSFTFAAQNGTTPYRWSLAAGSLPAGMTISTTGILAGTPTEDGFFTFTLRVQDALGGSAQRDLSMVVGESADPYRRIFAEVGDACQLTLSISGPWTSYLWLPGGETTPTIIVSPFETTTYGVIVSDGSGCPRRHSITIAGTILQNPSCLAPLVASISPADGPTAGGTPVVIAGSNFQPGATVTIGGVAATDVVIVDPTQITATTPALPAGFAYDVVILNPDSGNAAQWKGWFADFLDVPGSDPFHSAIETIVRDGVTAGCGAGNYCPSAPATRAQMAVFLLKSKYGSSHVPPPAVGLFADVPPSDPFAPWIEQLANMGVTAGCGSGNYCPSSPVTRAQMAVFLLKTRNGPVYSPPAPSGIFGDVPVSDPFAPWIEQIYNEGITGGCSASPLLYCPGSPTTRGQMAVFLVKTFSLQ